MKPRKTAELMLEILRSGKTCGVTQKTIDEVKAETGFVIPSEMAMMDEFPKEKPEGGEAMILACITYEPGEELALPDNETGLCGWKCGRTIQYRPDRPAWLTRVCLHCIAERPKEEN